MDIVESPKASARAQVAPEVRAESVPAEHKGHDKHREVPKCMRNRFEGQPL